MMQLYNHIISILEKMDSTKIEKELGENEFRITYKLSGTYKIVCNKTNIPDEHDFFIILFTPTSHNNIVYVNLKYLTDISILFPMVTEMIENAFGCYRLLALEDNMKDWVNQVTRKFESILLESLKGAKEWMI